MKNAIKSFLKQDPNIYRLVRTIYYKIRFRSLLLFLFGTKQYEKEWSERHLRKNRGDDWGLKESDWIKGYWNSADHPHRTFLIKKISAYVPISTILELGCCCGPNLFLLSKKLPEAKISGIDINPKAVEKGNEWFKKEGVTNVSLSVGRADELSKISDNSIDIVFTDAILIYIGPDKIKKVIKEMIRIACGSLIFCEWHDFSQQDKSGLGVSQLGLWKRDYIKLLKEFMPEDKISITKIPNDCWPAEGWVENGAIVEVSLKNKIL